MVQGGIISIGDKLLSLVVIEGPDFFDQAQEGAPTIVQMGEPMLHFCRAERMHVEGDILTVLAVAVAFERAHLIKGDTEIGAAKGFIFVEFQPVLIVEMNGPKLVHRQRKGHFIGWIEPGQNRVC